MTTRERKIRTINFKGSDRAPVMHAVLSAACILKFSLTCFSIFLLGVTYFQIKGCLNCPGSPVEAKIPVSYYYERGNPECIRATKLLQILSSNYGELEIKMEDIDKPEVKDWLAYLNNTYRGSSKIEVPAVFVGEQLFLVGYKEIYKGLLEEVIPQIENEYPRNFKRVLLKILRRLKISMVTFSGSMLATTVITAGLVDGINPCAISLLIFLISFLGRFQNAQKRILSMGISFILGSFLTYFMIGLGILKLVTTPLFVTIYNFVYIVFGILAILLGILSIVDAYYAKRTQIRKMKLQLPMGIKKVSHYFVRNIPNTNIIVGFLLGILMALFEFPCSGQVYLPTITLIGNPLSGGKQLLLLSIYNFMFVLPLILIVLASTYYLTSSEISSFISRNLFKVKILTALLFFILGTYMLFLV
jgi:cytochrome c biogenesis protein CcdA